MATDLESLRDLALPTVERALVALESAPGDASNLVKALDLIARSGLPADRRDALVGRLWQDQVTADGVAAAFERFFPGAQPDARGEVARALGRVWEALAGGRAEGGTWRFEVATAAGLEARSVDVGGPQGADLVGSLYGALSPDLAGRYGPEAFVSFAGAVQWLLRDDELDDDAGDDDGADGG